MLRCRFPRFLMLLFNVCDYNKQCALLKTSSLIEMLLAMNNSFLKIDVLLLHPIKNGWGGGGGGVTGSRCCFSFSWKLKIIRIVAGQCKKSESHVASLFAFLVSYSSSEVPSLPCCLSASIHVNTLGYGLILCGWRKAHSEVGGSMFPGLCPGNSH